MNDMTEWLSGFWSGWVVVLTVTSLVALIWLVWRIYFPASAEPSEHAGQAEPVWDETLREGSHAPPLWWFWFIFCLLIFSVAYLVLYPGLGNYRGIAQWTHDSHLQDRQNAYQQQFGAIRQAIAARPLTELQADPQLMAIAGRIFSRNCAACHGENARGQAKLFPNLRDDDWQWGGSPQAIEQSIIAGRTATMPPWRAVLDEDKLEEIADYVRNFRHNTLQNTRAQHPAHQTYTRLCTACHGQNGKGNPTLGTPNLADLSWTYGNTPEDVMHTVAYGRVGVMPAFGERLDRTQTRLLVAWLGRE